MHAVSAGGQRNIEPVVDQHPGAVGTRNFQDRRHEIAQFVGGKVFFANLNQLAAGPGRSPDGLELIFTAEESSAVGYQIEQRIGEAWNQWISLQLTDC